MSSQDAIERVEAQLKSATSFAAIFGPMPVGDNAAQKKVLRQQFMYLSQIVYPDYAPIEMRPKANEVFRILNERWKAAEATIMAGTYDSSYSTAHPSQPAEAAIELRSASGIYRLNRDPFRVGDLSTLYHGQILNAAGTEVIVKVASVPRNNTELEHEAKILQQFHSASATDPLSKIKRYVPEILDSLFVAAEGGRRFRATVMKWVPDLVSVADIIQAFPKGLPAQDAAWVCRRIIAQTLASSMAGFVHGAITPDHILVNPSTHEPLHIGWTQAVGNEGKNHKRITFVMDRWKDLYPSEVFAKKIPDHRIDIFMAGKTMIKLLGGDVARNTLPSSVPGAMSAVILRCGESSPARRYENGAQALDEITLAARSIWGNVYRPLTMPSR